MKINIVRKVTVFNMQPLFFLTSILLDHICHICSLNNSLCDQKTNNSDRETISFTEAYE
jgi:hypothetical protein